MNPTGTNIEKATVRNLIPFVYLLFMPTDWNDDENPWRRCNPKKTNDKQYINTLIGL